jgi:hypothetical protein
MLCNSAYVGNSNFSPSEHPLKASNTTAIKQAMACFFKILHPCYLHISLVPQHPAGCRSYQRSNRDAIGQLCLHYSAVSVRITARASKNVIISDALPTPEMLLPSDPRAIPCIPVKNLPTIVRNTKKEKVSWQFTFC